MCYVASLNTSVLKNNGTAQIWSWFEKKHVSKWAPEPRCDPSAGGGKNP